jgi:hypothetical protein
MKKINKIINNNGEEDIEYVFQPTAHAAPTRSYFGGGTEERYGHCEIVSSAASFDEGVAFDAHSGYEIWGQIKKITGSYINSDQTSIKIDYPVSNHNIAILNAKIQNKDLNLINGQIVYAENEITITFDWQDTTTINYIIYYIIQGGN